MNFVKHLLNVLLNVQGHKSLNSHFRIIQHCKGSLVGNPGGENI